jgi:hypothetical protein
MTVGARARPSDVFEAAAYMAGMTDISTIALARREDARQTTGRFGEQEHTGPEVELALDDDDLAPKSEVAAERELWAGILDDVQRAASMYASRRGQWNDRDDIIGDTIVDILGQQKRGTTHINDDAFKQNAVRAVSSRYIDPNAHHTTLKGRRMFNAALDNRMQDLGRDLTTKERSELADEIRLSFPAGRRPSIGFEQKNTAVSLDLQVGEDGSTTLGDLIAAEDRASGYSIDESKAAMAHEAYEKEGGSFKVADARKNIWNLLAENGPQVAVKTIHDDRAHRTAVADFGGAAAAARAWQQGETSEDDPVNVALFAPFGNLSEKQQEEVTDILLRNPGFAEKVWDSAMTAALDATKLRSIKRRENRLAAQAD